MPLVGRTGAALCDTGNGLVYGPAVAPKEVGDRHCGRPAGPSRAVKIDCMARRLVVLERTNARQNNDRRIIVLAPCSEPSQD
jgi:hypothetical protein